MDTENILQQLRISPMLKNGEMSRSKWECILLLTRHILVVRAYQVGTNHRDFKVFIEAQKKNNLLGLINLEPEEGEEIDEIPDEEITKTLDIQDGTLLEILQGETMKDAFWNRVEFETCSQLVSLGPLLKGEEKEIKDRVNGAFIRWNPMLNGALGQYISNELLAEFNGPSGATNPVFNCPCVVRILAESSGEQDKEEAIPLHLNIGVGAFSMFEYRYFSNFTTRQYVLVFKIDLQPDGSHEVIAREPGCAWVASNKKSKAKLDRIPRQGASLLVYAAFEPVEYENYRESERARRQPQEDTKDKTTVTNKKNSGYFAEILQRLEQSSKIGEQGSGPQLHLQPTCQTPLEIPGVKTEEHPRGQKRTSHDRGKARSSGTHPPASPLQNETSGQFPSVGRHKKTRYQ